MLPLYDIFNTSGFRLINSESLSTFNIHLDEPVPFREVKVDGQKLFNDAAIRPRMQIDFHSSERSTTSQGHWK